MWIAKMREQVELMTKDVNEAIALVKSFDRRLKAIEQVAFGNGKPAKKAK